MQGEIPAQFRAKFRESANRPHLLMGCEPTAIATVFVLSVIVAFSVPTFKGVGLAIALFFVLRYGLRTLAAEDPKLIGIHHHSQRYAQRFWTARSKHPHRWASR
jgi:type IV secretory pathway TrbD component